MTSLQVTSFYWLIFLVFASAIVTRRLKAPYTVGLVVSGIVVGELHLLPQLHLDPHVLFTVLLPPLLFESALNIPAAPLLKDWKPIALYTVLGTAASTFIAAQLMHLVAGLPLGPSLVFGALISATDPISVIATFRKLGAGRRLSLILEAESLFNDGTAVVLFTVMLASLTGRTPTALEGAADLLRLLLGGAAVGGAMGFAASWAHGELDDPLVEITLTTLAAFGSFLLADTLHVSGVVAVVAAGLVVGSHGMQTAITPGVRMAVTSFWDYAAFLSNSIVFLLVGIEVAHVHWQDRWRLGLVSVLAVLTGRASVYPISLLVNRLGGAIPLKWQHVLVWGGMRGALSMAIALGLSAQTPFRETLIVATFSVAVTSLLLQGMTIAPLVRRLGLTTERAPRTRAEERVAAEISACQAALLELERLAATDSYLPSVLHALEERYQARLQALIEGVDSGHPHSAVEALQERTARTSALQGERSAYQEAHRKGGLADADWEQVRLKIDSELLELAGRREKREDQVQ